MPSSRNRLPARLLTVAVLAAAGGAAWYVAREAADVVEQQSRMQLEAAMQKAGRDWVSVESDGLQLLLTGTAPSEIDRFRAVADAAEIANPKRIIDEIEVAKKEILTVPEFRIELLRNDEGISLIGLVPASTDRQALIETLRENTAAPKISDLLESADYPAPPQWNEAVEFALRAAQLTPRAKISIEPDRVEIVAVTETRAEKGRLTAEFGRAQPDGIDLSMDISAPRPVITPFKLTFLIDDEGARFDACAASSEAGEQLILDAAISAGVTGTPGCTVALGAPSEKWSDAAVASIEAVAEIGHARVEMTGPEISLKAPADTDPGRFDKAIATLKDRLPPVFSLNAQQEQPENPDEGPVEFLATMSADGELSMRGRIAGDKMREAVHSLAQARFTAVEDNLRSDEELPGGWTVKAIAGIEALDVLDRGSLKVTPESIELSGVSGDTAAADRVVSALSKRLGAGERYSLSIRYDRRLDPSLDLPDGDECVDRLNIIMSESAIGFEPSRSTIAGDPSETLDRLAEVMENCAEFQIEAGGHTDSQGSEGFNADLSRARAQALVGAMKEADIDTGNITSRGYGESQPIASNDTEAGREENRRIEFVLISENPVSSEPLPPPVVVEGATVAASPEVLPIPIITVEREEPAEDSTNDEAEIDAPSPAAPATVGAREEVEEVTVTPVTGEVPRPRPRPDAGLTDDETNGN